MFRTGFVGLESDQFIDARDSYTMQDQQTKATAQASRLIELKINRVELNEALQKIIDVASRLHSSDEKTSQWIEIVCNLLESFRVQVLSCPPGEPIEEKQFNFIKRIKDKIVEKLAFKKKILGFKLKLEPVMMRLWLVASTRFLNDINDYDITGPFAAPAIKVQAEKTPNGAI